ncbi:Alpha/beta hydrolase fold protein [Nostocoides japonicum T1-X7]|uniref:Alpha/beta hydrolase fold protein n=1 Tax=Nostocoides japonicum T1-X7 TaxID=1194083 RepID=A0A077M5U3_9MICO|nr:alpha/beta fold hydrolase [Tetrasphaera japonica]CCH79544.1 Alpha/beta hydrolase fold protein [Tetrasphaera japonica T1-X7]
MVSLPNPLGTIDRVRREIDRNALRARNGIRMATGIQRTDVGLSPKDVVWESGRCQLWHYRSDQVSLGPPLLIIYSLFNRSYILDLRPGNSVIEHLLSAGFDVYMIDWGVPDERDAANQLEDYVDYFMPAAIRRVCELSGASEINLFGYCFGGVLSVLHTAHHPETPLRSLTVLTTPCDLREMGPMTEIMSRSDLEDVLGPDGMVPASVILQGFRTLAPMGEVTGRLDLWEKMWSDDYVTAYQAMTGWATDQVPLPGGVARQFKRMVDENAFVNDRIVLGGDRVRLADIQLPFLHVLGLRDHIVPVASAAPLVGLVGSEDKEEMRLDAGHVGLMVGRTAAKNTVPKIIEFLKKRSEALT